jgi:hypothetical protein
MRVPVFALALVTFLLCIFVTLPIEAQQTSSTAQNASAPDDGVEGVIVSATRNTVVVRSDDSQFHLFTFDHLGTRPASLAVNTRVRVTAGDPDENGTRVATNVTVLSSSSGTSASVDKGAQAAPVPEKVRDVESDIKRESKRWHLGVRAGAAFDPELFMFGVHSQMGPIFTPRVMFRPSAEFAF